MFCRSLFVLLYFFFWPLCSLFFFDIRILITPLVSSNSFYLSNNFHNVSTMHVQQCICQTYATIYMLNIYHTLSVKPMPHFIFHTYATMYLSFPCHKLPVKPMPQIICLTYVTIFPSKICNMTSVKGKTMYLSHTCH